MSSLLRNHISHERFKLHQGAATTTALNIMVVFALNVGPLFFSFVPSLNDDICEPFALKKLELLMWLLLFLLKQTCVCRLTRA